MSSKAVEALSTRNSFLLPPHFSKEWIGLEAWPYQLRILIGKESIKHINRQSGRNLKRGSNGSFEEEE